MKSLTDTLESIDHAIFLLNEIKEGLTEVNHKELNIEISQCRDLKPIRSVQLMGVPVGFEQTSPDILSVVVKNYKNSGKLFVH